MLAVVMLVEVQASKKKQMREEVLRGGANWELECVIDNDTDSN